VFSRMDQYGVVDDIFCFILFTTAFFVRGISWTLPFVLW
jgi:hypothetical protein